MNAVSQISLRYESPAEEEQRARIVREVRGYLHSRGVPTSLPASDPVQDARGDPVALSQIFIQLLSAGSVGTLIECVFNFLSRDDKSRIEIEKDGKRLVFEGRPADLPELAKQVEQFLK